ncbi:hypothetical protein CEV33_3667 [Brucella grignonensis]|uniref:Uncharacterized protein n=1 Tax=Brucella grignonensis TaxID=94627 RepID=A0A256EYQ5_9HYPH|nr:hypothetical protein CEV33_3667 [Brucella grignonensis]
MALKPPYRQTSPQLYQKEFSTFDPTQCDIAWLDAIMAFKTSMQCDWLKLIGARCNKAALLLFVGFWIFDPL